MRKDFVRDQRTGSPPASLRAPEHEAPVGLPSPGRRCSLTTQGNSPPGSRADHSAASGAGVTTGRGWCNTPTAQGSAPGRRGRSQREPGRREPGSRQRGYRRTVAADPVPRRATFWPAQACVRFRRRFPAKGVGREKVRRQLAGRVSRRIPPTPTTRRARPGRTGVQETRGTDGGRSRQNAHGRRRPLVRLRSPDPARSAGCSGGRPPADPEPGRATVRRRSDDVSGAAAGTRRGSNLCGTVVSISALGQGPRIRPRPEWSNEPPRPSPAPSEADRMIPAASAAAGRSVPVRAGGVGDARLARPGLRRASMYNLM